MYLAARAAIGLVASGLAACYAPQPPLGVACNRADECPRALACDPTSLTCVDPEELAATDLGAFGPSRRIAELSEVDANDGDPTWTADRTLVVFTSDRGGGIDLWTATRASADLPWSAPTRIVELSNAATEYSPELSPDGLVLWFSVAGVVLESARSDRAAAWPTARPIAGIGTVTQDLAISGDRRAFVIERATGGDTNLALRTRPTGDAAWSTERAVDELNTADLDEGSPGLDLTGLRLFYARGTSFAEYDIYEAVRQPDGRYAPGVARITGAGRDADPAPTPDGRHLLFSRGDQDRDLYEADR